MAQRIKRLIPKIPSELYIEHEGEEVLSLDGYLWLANELGASISTTIAQTSNECIAKATVEINGSRWSAEAIAAQSDDTEDPVSRAQSKALLKTLLTIFRPYLRAAQPESRRSLMVAVQAMYRERGYNKQERLQHAAQILCREVQSFSDLDAYEIAELVVNLTSPPSSQYQ